MRIDPHENLRDHLLVSLRGDLERREQVAFEPEQGIYALLDEIFLLVRQLGFTLLGIALVELADEGLPERAQPVLLVGGKSLAHRRDEPRVPIGSSIGVLENARDRVKRYPDGALLERLVLYRHPVK